MFLIFITICYLFNKLAHDNHRDVLFSPKTCALINSDTKFVQGIGYLRDGLYYLNNDLVPSNSQCLTVNTDDVPVNSSSQYNLWHNRLGHASVSKLKHINCIKPFLPTDNQLCLTCPVAKFTKLPFTSSHSSAKPFELIHLDIWGPYKVATRKKYRYFLTIVDDHTMMTWLYLLHHKSDYLSTFKMFHAYVLNHFSTTILTIRSDNALEFCDKEFQKFYMDQGIIPQTSCSYRPQ